MFKNRSPFMIPTIPGSLGRKRNKMQSQSRQKQLQIVEQKQQNIQKKNCKVLLNTPNSSSPATLDERFAFSLTQPVQQNSTVFWQYQLTNQVTGQYNRKLIFRQQQFCLRGVTDSTMYDQISIVSDGVPGYKDQSGIITNRVCILQLSQIQALFDDANTKTYDVLYKQAQDVAWDIPMNLSAINFKILTQQGYLTNQLNSPLSCQFDIRHVGR